MSEQIYYIESTIFADGEDYANDKVIRLNGEKKLVVRNTDSPVYGYTTLFTVKDAQWQAKMYNQQFAQEIQDGVQSPFTVKMLDVNTIE
jgi:hypothetical protein